LVTGGPNSPHDGVVNEAVLTGRKYLVVRPIAGSPVRVTSTFIDYQIQALIFEPKVEKGEDAQRRIINEFYSTVHDYDPN
jgi:myo-inositol-1(or 4)-monophosphatase